MVLLSALFLSFVMYGILIIFFLVTSSWSLPFQLSRGHTLVERMEKDLSFMQVRKNRIEQDLSIAKIDRDKALRANRDSKSKLQLLDKTIIEETRRLEVRSEDLSEHIVQLDKVITDYEDLGYHDRMATELHTAFKQRIITKTALDRGTLMALESRHRMASIRHEVTLADRELEHILINVAFLRSLKAELQKPEMSDFKATESEYSNLAAKVVDAKNGIATTARDLSVAEKKIQKLSNSLGVFKTSVASLEKTPAARALKHPVQVLFVPYINEAAISRGTELYTCRFGIVWCTRVGTVGEPIDGETVVPHPLFAKPLRGTFYEAEFTSEHAVTEDLIHAGRPPLFF